MIIYKTTNKINGKIYVGQFSNKKKYFNSYFGSGVLIKKAIKKHGKENFTKEVLQECKTIQELNDAEIYWIDKLNSTDISIGYNLSMGGKGTTGFHPTIESREKMRQARLNHIKNGDKVWPTGSKHSEETKEKCRVAFKDKTYEEMYGVDVAQKRKKKISEKNKGKTYSRVYKPLSDETKKKMSDAKKNFIPWNKGLKNIKHKRKVKT